MEFMHVKAIFIRHIRLWMHAKNMFAAIIYWPLYDILVWGFLGLWMQQNYNDSASAAILLLNTLLFQLTRRGGGGVFLAFVEEVITHNISPLFALPLRLSEWIAGVLAFVSLQIIIIMVAGISLTLAFGGVPLYTILMALLIFGPALILFGIALGFIINQIIIFLGRSGYEISFIINAFFTPFSGAFYPIEALPYWAQYISKILPLTYIFQALRIFWQGTEPYGALLITGYILSGIYAAVAVTLFVLLFHSAKQRGLARICD